MKVLDENKRIMKWDVKEVIIITLSLVIVTEIRAVAAKPFFF